MSKQKYKHKHKPTSGPPRTATFHGSVLQCIRQHARSSLNAEICGALIGRQSETGTVVVGAVRGEGATHGGAHVTFTQEAWVRIHEEKDRKYSGLAIVGWYHSHPGFGVFLSDHDVFIHKHFFSGLGSLAWVYDPHSDEEGCFGWNGGEVRRLECFGVVLDSSKDTGPRSEPSIPVEGAKYISHFTAWRSPKLRRVFLVSGLIILFILLVAFAGFVLRHSAFPGRSVEWFKQRRIDRPTTAETAPMTERARKDTTVNSEGKHGTAGSIPAAHNDNDRN